MNATLHMPSRHHPACFNGEQQYRQWRELAVKTRAGDSDFCTDCTRVYQIEMIAQCRCAHQRTRFFADCDGYIEGRRPISERLVNCKKKGRR